MVHTAVASPAGSTATSADTARALATSATGPHVGADSAETAAALAALGHRVVRRAVPLCGAQAVLVDAERGVLVGVSDGRKDGCALGY